MIGHTLGDVRVGDAAGGDRITETRGIDPAGEVVGILQERRLASTAPGHALARIVHRREGLAARRVELEQVGRAHRAGVLSPEPQLVDGPPVEVHRIGLGVAHGRVVGDSTRQPDIEGPHEGHVLEEGRPQLCEPFGHIIGAVSRRRDV